jgi:hypothetical protein
MTTVDWLIQQLNAMDLLKIVDGSNAITFTIKQAKEMEKQQQDEFGIGFAEWITTEKSKYSILYGNQEKRFATFEKDYTSKELLEIYKKENNL